MSTSYYGLRKPVTHLQIEDSNQAHTKISIWIDHGHSGTLTVPTPSLEEFLALLFDQDIYPTPLITYWGGKSRGTVVMINDEDIPDYAVVISEYGELLSVGQVKTRNGAKRSDGLPTELFGYEEE